MQVVAGYSQPLGVTPSPEGINFAIFSKHASAVTLCLFEESTLNLLDEIQFNPQIHKTGDIWHLLIRNLPSHLLYAYKIDGPTIEEKKSYYDPEKILLDPYAKALNTSNRWGNQPYAPLGVIPYEESAFDWESIKKPQIPIKDLMIYEMHVRGFTQDPSSQVKHRGTFLGVIEKIPYLLDLGINAVELLPIFEFNESEYLKTNPHTHERLYNYWGYSTNHYFSLMNRYASTDLPEDAIKEFKTMVKELHRKGIEVILDVVYNHTGEIDKNGPTFSFRGIDNSVYYILNPQGEYEDFTGCGNTFRCNHPVVIDLILSSLRYWSLEMGVDGFRFDLASILSRDKKGFYTASSPIIDAISQDPLLANIKLIAEPWDAVGLYQVGTFYPEEIRWSEWNGKYRDTIRRFIKGTPGHKGKFATRLSGSQDLYHQRAPYSSINFVTAHDGFTLADLVSYNQKHNLDNGENNQDGASNNLSWNCGEEGPSSNIQINGLREIQMKNFHLVLMVSQGVPLLLMGDEYAHTKRGNNNTWCQDNSLNWFLWNKLEENKSFYRFYRLLNHFRKNHPILRRENFLNEKDILWHGLEPFSPLWEVDNSFIAFTLIDHHKHENLYIAFNAHHDAMEVHFPTPGEGRHWCWVVNTSQNSPQDILEEGHLIALQNSSYRMAGHSSLLLKSTSSML